MNKCVGELDKIFAFLCILVTLCFAIWFALIKPHLYIVPLTLAFLSCISYLIIRNRLSPFNSLSLSPTNNRLYIVLNSLYFLLLASSTILLCFKPEPYIRPLSYFILITLMAAVLAIEIMFCVDRKWYSLFALLKVILIPISLVGSQVFLFPSVIGADGWYHQAFTLRIADLGYITRDSAYSALPIMHLIVWATMFATSLSYKVAALLSVSLLQIVCDLSLVFLIGRFICGTKVGLLAALLLGIGSQHLLYGIWAIPNTLGAPLTLVVLYLLVVVKTRRPILAITLSLFFMVTLILTHTLSSMALGIILLALWIGFGINSKIQNKRLTNPVPASLVALFIVSTFSWWIYVSGHINWLARWMVGEFKIILGVEGASPTFGSGVIQWDHFVFHVPFWEQLFSYIGFFLFLALSLAGCLYMVSKNGNRYSFAFAFTAVILLAVAFLPFILGITVIAGRWWYFTQVMMAIPVGVALFWFCGVIKNGLVRAFLIVILTSFITFFMIISPTANQDNPVLSPNIGVREAYTQVEIQAVKDITSMWDGEIGTTHLLRLRDMPGLDFEAGGIAQELYDRDFSDTEYELIVVSKEITEHSFLLDGAVYRLDYDLYELLASQGFNKIYDNGAVSAWRR